MKIVVRLSDLIHVVAGLIAAFAPPHLAVLISMLFVIYELDEDWHLHDKAYQDIREFLIGLVMGTVFRLLLHV